APSGARSVAHVDPRPGRLRRLLEGPGGRVRRRPTGAAAAARSASPHRTRGRDSPGLHRARVAPRMARPRLAVPDSGPCRSTAGAFIVPGSPTPRIRPAQIDAPALGALAPRSSKGSSAPVEPETTARDRKSVV